PVALAKARTERLRSDGGGASSSVHSGASSDVYTHPHHQAHNHSSNLERTESTRCTPGEAARSVRRTNGQKLCNMQQPHIGRKGSRTRSTTLIPYKRPGSPDAERDRLGPLARRRHQPQ